MNCAPSEIALPFAQNPEKSSPCIDLRNGLAMSRTITLSCAKCGSNEFDYPGGVQANLKASDTITCKGCGASDTYGSAIESAKKQIADKLRRSLGKFFK